MAPLHVESQYRWPFYGAIAKFTSKLLSKEKLPYKFQELILCQDHKFTDLNLKFCRNSRNFANSPNAIIFDLPDLDGHDIHLKNFIGRLQDLMINDVVEGAKVLVEYIPISYFGRKPGKKEGD